MELITQQGKSNKLRLSSYMKFVLKNRIHILLS